MGTDAYQNGNIVYLAHPAAWYTAEGGINALDVMLKDLESVLLSKEPLNKSRKSAASSEKQGKPLSERA